MKNIYFNQEPKEKEVGNKDKSFVNLYEFQFIENYPHFQRFSQKEIDD